MPKFLIPGDKVDPNPQFILLPEGDYACTVDASLASEAKTSQTGTGNQYVTMLYHVPFQELPGAPAKDVKVRDIIMVEGDGVFRAVQLSAACGLPVQKGVDFVFDPAQLHNRRCRITITHEVRNNQKRHRVSNYAPLDAAAAAMPAAPPAAQAAPIPGAGAPPLPPSF